MYQFHYQLTLIEERREHARSTDKNPTKPWTNLVVPLPAANLAWRVLGGGERCLACFAWLESGNEEGNGEGGKRDGDGNKEGKGEGGKRDGNGD
jgi:hypothetical protein